MAPCVKGDIIYFEPDVSVSNYDCHIGFFWGNTPSDNKFWHSYYPDGNIISDIKTKSPAEKIYVFHNAKEEGYISLKKVNDKGDNMAGVSFKLTADGKSTTVKNRRKWEFKVTKLSYRYCGGVRRNGYDRWSLY
nr:hypothetical protein [Enterococcus avium]